MGRFYKDFASVYGTLWLITLAAAVLTQRHIDTGIVGFLGFPLISFLYAAMRSSSETGEIERLHGRIRSLKRQLAEAGE